MALTYTPSPDLGKPAPAFSLIGTDGKTWTQQDLIKDGRPGVLVFMCNHCPYVKAIEKRLVELGKDLNKINVPMLAISSNDASRYPDDSFENMQLLSQKNQYSFPYLYDETQEVAKAYGAVCTPDFFVYDINGKLAYRGRLDDSWKDESQVKSRELYLAVLDLVAGKSVSSAQTPSMGCSIKWKGQ